MDDMTAGAGPGAGPVPGSATGGLPGRKHPVSTWTAEATVRTTRRVDVSEVGALRRIVTAAHCVARSSGAQGVCLRMTVEAGTRSGAYGSALSLLATEVLPHLEGADLTDLRIVAEDPVPGTGSVHQRVPMAP